MIGILVAEVQPEIAELLKPHLSEEEFRISTTTDGESALKLIAADPPDLLIVDTTLGKLEGLEVLSRLRSRRATWSLPVIVVTSRTDNQPYELALQLRANDYLTKPVDAAKLVAEIGKILKRSIAA